ncbi:TPA: cell wall hydrolase [Clostridioides difficile]|nr:cell wall hydrolase [Clostridioides difficile]
MSLFKNLDKGLITLGLVTTLSASLGANYHQYDQNKKLSEDINTKAESIKVLETKIEGQKNAIDSIEQSLEEAEATVKEQNTLLLDKDATIGRLKKDLKKAEAKTSAKSISRTRGAVRSTGQRLNVTPKERELMARLVEAEGGIEPYRGKIAIANVIINRVLDSRYPNTIRGVIYQNSQFSGTSMMYDRPTGDDCYRAVDEALSGVNVVPTNTISFWADYLDPSNSLWDLPITARIGGHVFTNAY